LLPEWLQIDSESIGGSIVGFGGGMVEIGRGKKKRSHIM
jgi:hypothetical protein